MAAPAEPVPGDISNSEGLFSTTQLCLPVVPAWIEGRLLVPLYYFVKIAPEIGSRTPVGWLYAARCGLLEYQKCPGDPYAIAFCPGC